MSSRVGRQALIGRSKELSVGKSPFALDEAPLKLSVEARKVPTWRAVDGVADPLPESPVTSTESIETITLVPYAAAKLRITSFPELEKL